MIRIGDLRIPAECNDSEIARRIWDHLPLTARVRTWGREIFFKVPIEGDVAGGETQEVVEKGDIAFWPEEGCFCIFFGATPASVGKEIRHGQSGQHVLGYLQGDYNRLNHVREDDEIVAGTIG